MTVPAVPEGENGETEIAPMPKVPLPADWCGCTHNADDHLLRGSCRKCDCDGFRSTEDGVALREGFWVQNCADCDGSGRYLLPDDGTQSCVPCKGTGRTYIVLGDPS